MNSLQRFLKKYSIIWVALYFLGMTLFMTWPLVLKMGNSIVGQLGDNIYFIWMIGWVNKALFQLGVDPFNVWFLNYPQGWSLAYTEITPAEIALALPFGLLAGPTFGYNAAMMLTFILSGLGMYWWIFKRTDSVLPALIAGTIFAYLPYHFAHFRIGHLNLVGIQWFPLYFLGFFTIYWKPDSLTGNQQF